jgi:hypothetical protein
MKILPAVWVVIVISLATSGCNAPTATQSVGSLVLFQDDFSDTSGGWYRSDTEDGITDYYNEGYRIFINRSDYYLWSNPKDLSFSDVRIEVDASKIGGPDFNEIGVICRYKDSKNFYFFIISSDGYYSVNKFIDGVEQWIGMEQPQFDDTNIRTGDTTNYIRVDCIQQNLSLSVNGKLLTTVTDSDLKEGNVGLIAGTWDIAGTDVLFENFKVERP